MKRGKGFTLVELLVTLGIIGVLSVLILPALSRKREMQRRSACQGNLSQIIKAIIMYTMDYKDYYPTSAGPGKEINVKAHYRDLGLLYLDYITSIDVFTCPSSGDRMPRTPGNYWYDWSVAKNQAPRPFPDKEAMQVSFAYSFNGKGGKNQPWTDKAPSTTLILADRPATRELTNRSNHGKHGRNVAYADGHIRWLAGRGKLLTDPDNPDPEIGSASWWSERPDKPARKD